MFHCERCHTEYGGIRGLPAGSCPRCRELGQAQEAGSPAGLQQAAPASLEELTVTLSGPLPTAFTFVGSRPCPA